MGNKLLRFFCSLPVVLVITYFIPFLGVFLLICRLYVYREIKCYKTWILMFLFAIIIALPKFVSYILITFNLTNINIPYLSEINISDVYLRLMEYSKMIVIISVVFFVLTLILKNVLKNLIYKINSSIIESERKHANIIKENDLIMREKRKG